MRIRHLFQTDFRFSACKRNCYFAMCYIPSQCTLQVENYMRRWGILTLSERFAAAVDEFHPHLPATLTLHDDYQKSNAWEARGHQISWRSEVSDHRLELGFGSDGEFRRVRGKNGEFCTSLPH